MNTIIFIMLFGILGQFSVQDPMTEEENYQDEMGFYVISFYYDTSFSTNRGWNPPEYSAKITVYRIIDGKKVQVGKSFEGTYHERGGYSQEHLKWFIKQAGEVIK